MQSGCQGKKEEDNLQWLYNMTYVMATHDHTTCIEMELAKPQKLKTYGSLSVWGSNVMKTLPLLPLHIY